MLRTLSTTTKTSPLAATKQLPVKYASTAAASKQSSTGEAEQPQSQKEAPKQAPAEKKTMAELDEELRLKMQGIAGDGGESGVEYEDGKPVAMKRGVKENMFRLI